MECKFLSCNTILDDERRKEIPKEGGEKTLLGCKGKSMDSYILLASFPLFYNFIKMREDGGVFSGRQA